MKKILIASTALVATAGVAAAEVSFGGFGRFGIIYNEDGGTTGNDSTRLEQRFRLTATGTTETDGGVKFEGRIRLQSDDNAAGAGGVANSSAAGFAVSSGGLRVDVGHVSDVLDSGDVVDYFGYGVGLTSWAEQSSGFALPASGFGTGTAAVAPTVKARYSAGDLTVAASVSTDASGTANEEYQLGASYAFGGYTAGIAFGNEDDGTVGGDVDFWAASLGGSVGDFDFSILVADYDDGVTSTAYGVSVQYAISSATQIRAVYNDNGAAVDENTYAIGFQHSLGGGVSLRGGVGETGGGDAADLGVVFNF